MVGVVVYLSLMPAPPQLAMTYGDKLQHVAAYSAMAYWFAMLEIANVNKRRVAMFALILLGILLEFLQGLTAHRTFDVGDMLANTLGVLIGGLIAASGAGALLAWLEGHLNNLLGGVRRH